MNNRMRNKEEHAKKIRQKYYLEDVHIYMLHNNGWHYIDGDWKNRQKIIYISQSPIKNFDEIRAPHTLDKIIKMLKDDKAVIEDMTDRQVYTFEEYQYNKMILRLAGVE